MNSFKNKKILIPLIIVTLVLLYALYNTGFYGWFMPKSEGDYISFLNIGQGNCAVLKCGDSIALVEAGCDDDDGVLIEGKLRSMGITEIELLVLTNAHSAYLGGTLSLLLNLSVETIICPVGTFEYENIHTTDILKAIEKAGTKLVYASAGDSIDFYGARIEMLWLHNDEQPKYKSMTVKLEREGASFLFLGDMPISAERKMVDSGVDLGCDVLVAADYGSRYSNSVAVLDAANPKICIISCGDPEYYDSPSKSIKTRLADRNIAAYVTFDIGDILFDFRDNKIHIKK